MTAVTEDFAPDTGRRGSVAFTVELVIAGLLVFALAITIGVLTGAASGTVADWVAAISTLAAFLAAVIAGRYAAQALTLERERDLQRDLEQRRARAELFAAWIEPPYEFANGNITNSNRPAGALGGIIFQSCRITVRSLSHLPIEIVRLHLYVRLGMDPESESAYFATYGIGTVLPLETSTVEVHDSPWIANRLYDRTLGFDPNLGVSVVVGWSFRDTVGRNWLQEPARELREVPYTLVPRVTDSGLGRPLERP